MRAAWFIRRIFPGKSALSQAQGADVIIKASGVGVFDNLLEQEVLRFQNSNTLVVFWDVDAPATLDRIKHDENDPFRGLISSYDLVLTYGGGYRVVNGYKQFGARKCVPVYNALDPLTHFRSVLIADLKKSWFLGSRLPDRKKIGRVFSNLQVYCLINCSYLGKRVAGDTNSYLMGISRHVFTYDHNTFNSSLLAVLNINHKAWLVGFSSYQVFRLPG